MEGFGLMGRDRPESQVPAAGQGRGQGGHRPEPGAAAGAQGLFLGHVLCSHRQEVPPGPVRGQRSQGLKVAPLS